MPSKPHREDLWDDYILKRHTGGKEVAVAYYAENRAVMDAGAKTTNPHRLEPGQLSSQSLAQIKTIHSMALRINEVMARFSSLATEMAEAENASQAETEETDSPISQRR
jgi:hypothetical protein